MTKKTSPEPTEAEEDKENNVKSNKANAPVHLNCMYTNADSLLNKRKELEANIVSIQPDIIAITEVFPNNPEVEVQKAELEIEGYDCLVSTGGRGVCIYTSKKLKAIPVIELATEIYSDSVWCEVRLRNSDKLLVGCIYRSPSSTSDNNARLCQVVNSACTRWISHLMILGDFNYSEIDWDTWTSSGSVNHPSWKMLDCLQNNFLYQKVDFNTRFREGQKPSLLDLVLLNEDEMVQNIEARSPLGKSDHVVISFQLLCYMEVESNTDTARFQYNKGDYNNMRNELSSVNWEEEMRSKDANNAWKLFANKIHEAMEKSIPKL